MNRYSMHDVIASTPAEKRKSDGTPTRILFRPLSYPLSALALNLNIRPNSVTYFSFLCCLAGFILALMPDIRLHFVSAAMFLLFGILDCADGNMARTLFRLKGKTTVYGSAVDAAGGYFAYTTEILAIGLSSALVTGRREWFLLAAVTAAANLLMRLFHQSFKNAELAAGIPSAPGKEKRFSEEIGVTGWMPLLYPAAAALSLLPDKRFSSALPAILVFYAAVYCGGFAVTSWKLMRKVSARDGK